MRQALDVGRHKKKRRHEMGITYMHRDREAGNKPTGKRTGTEGKSRGKIGSKRSKQ